MWLALALGAVGLAAGGVLSFAMFHRAFGKGRSWRASALMTFLIMIGAGAVTNQEPFWIIAGSVLWALLSPELKHFDKSPNRYVTNADAMCGIKSLAGA
jgi:hypothetical protein